MSVDTNIVTNSIIIVMKCICPFSLLSLAQFPLLSVFLLENAIFVEMNLIYLV